MNPDSALRIGIRRRLRRISKLLVLAAIGAFGVVGNSSMPNGTATLSVSVQGDRLVDANGHAMQLRGAGLAGLESGVIQEAIPAQPGCVTAGQARPPPGGAQATYACTDQTPVTASAVPYGSSSSGTSGGSLSSSFGSGSGSSSSGGKPPGAFGVKVSGNHFISTLTGATVQLRGANVSGLETGIIFGPSNSTNFWASSGLTGGRPDFTKLGAWKLNAVRLSLNEDSWLGLTVKGIPGNTIVLHGAAFRAEARATVAAANAAGLYVILDLHWSAPSNFAANVQNPMADTDNSVNFWTSVANTFKSNPAVIFELFNEPYFDPVAQADGAFNKVTGELPNTAANEMLRNGGTANYYFGLSTGTWGGSERRVSYNWSVAGYQALINAVRSTGATNVILCGGNRYSNDLTWWGQNPPADPAGQLGAVIHLYPNGYPNNFTTGAGGSAQFDAMIAANTAKYPLVVTEFGDEVGNPNAAFTKAVTAWLDLHGYSVTAWAWSASPQSSNVLLQNATSYPPTVGFGQTYHDWAVNHP